LFHDFAFGGASADGVRAQIDVKFLPYAGKKPTWASWESHNSLFCILSPFCFDICLIYAVTWVGINDVAIGFNPRDQLTVLFQKQASLYEVGARHFIFFNIPPTDRSPGGRLATPVLLNIGNGSVRLRARIAEWNAALDECVEVFRRDHEDITVEIYDAAKLFTEVLDDPKKYGFKDAVSDCSDDGVWLDYLHPTSAMHKVLAADVVKFLTNYVKQHIPTESK
jgi:hypothetical protein